MGKKYDFSGWVTRHNTRCTDGVTINHSAFIDCDGKRVPLVWNHNGQNSPSNILGHIDLQHRDEGVYGFGYLNDTPEGKRAKKIIAHGDITAMSIGANKIKRTPANDVIHGNIYEVSLVLAGANPGALIESVITHSDNSGESIRFFDPKSTVHATNYILDEYIEHSDVDMNELINSLSEQELQATLGFAASLVDPDVPLNEIVDHLSDDDKEEVAEFILDLMAENDGEVEHSEELGDESAAEDDDDFDDNDDNEDDDSDDDFDDEEDSDDDFDDEEDDEEDDTEEDEDEVTVDDVLEVIDSLDESTVISIWNKARSMVGEDVDDDDVFESLNEEQEAELLDFIADSLDEDDGVDADEVLEVIESMSDEEINGIIKFARELTGDNESDVESLLDSLDEEDTDVLTNYINTILKENSEMRHNMFSDQLTQEDVLKHGQLAESILTDGPRYGTLKESMIAHSVSATIDDFLNHGITDYEDELRHSISTIDQLLTVETFTGAPDLIRPEEPSLVDIILSKVKTTPKHTVRKRFADLTTEEARAKGYIKGNEKLEEVFGTFDRVTHPQTIYKKQSIDNDDLIDIDWDIVAFMRSEMREMWRYELARAIMIGDGRLVGAPDKIKEDHIRPIMSDDKFYTTQVYSVTTANFVEMVITHMATDYKGTGTPDMFVDKVMLAQVRLLKATDGHYLWGDRPISKTDLADLLGVKGIYEPDFLANTNKALVVNLSDYELASPNKGKSQSYEDFDIDFNKHKYLLEGRCAGALVQPKAAIVFRADAAPVTATSGSADE